MTDKPEETEVETEETEVEEPETESEESNDEQGWDRMSGLMRAIVREELSSWSGPKAKQTSSSSRKPPVKKASPPRKKGFLSSGFFQGLNPEE